jgi:hypothetical protein
VSFNGLTLEGFREPLTARPPGTPGEVCRLTDRHGHGLCKEIHDHQDLLENLPG